MVSAKNKWPSLLQSLIKGYKTPQLEMGYKIEYTTFCSINYQTEVTNIQW